MATQMELKWQGLVAGALDIIPTSETSQDDKNIPVINASLYKNTSLSHDDKPTLSESNPQNNLSLTDDPFSKDLFSKDLFSKDLFSKDLCAPRARPWFRFKTDKPALSQAEFFLTIAGALLQIAAPDKDLVITPFDMIADVSPRGGNMRVSAGFYKGQARTQAPFFTNGDVNCLLSLVVREAVNKGLYEVSSTLYPDSGETPRKLVALVTVRI